MALVRAGHQEPGGRRVRVVAEQLHQDVQQYGLAVLAGAEQERHDLRTHVAGDGVAEEQLQEVDHLRTFGPLAEGVGQEAVPARGGHRPGRRRGGARVEVFRGLGGAYVPGAQVHDARGGAQRVRVGVQPGRVEHHARGGLRLGEHRVHPAGAERTAAVLLQRGRGVDPAGVGGGDALRQVPGGPYDRVVLVDLPAGAVPPEPADAGDVAVVVVVELDEQFGVAAVAERVGQQSVRRRLAGGRRDADGARVGAPGIAGLLGSRDGLREDLRGDGLHVEAGQHAVVLHAHTRPPSASGRARPAPMPPLMMALHRRCCPGRARSAVSCRARAASAPVTYPAATSPPAV